MFQPLRLSMIVLLTLLGVCGLVRLPLMPPLLARSGSDTQLSDLEAQEALLEARQEAASQMTRFVGGQITRHYWGGFTPYLDVLGVEIPATMESTLTVSDDRARLVLDPKRVNERYVAEVVRAGTRARGVVCRGQGEPGEFVLRGRATQTHRARLARGTPHHGLAFQPAPPRRHNAHSPAWDQAPIAPGHHSP